MASIQTSTASVSQLAAPVASGVMITDSVPSRKRHLQKGVSVSTHRTLSHKRSRINFSSTLYSRLVRSALDSLDKRDTSAIDQLTSQILLPPTSPDCLTTESLTTILTVLSQHVSRLDNRAVTPLIQALLKYDFLSHLSDTQFIKSYSTFLTVLVSGMPKWFSSISKILISSFTVKSEIELQPIHKTLKYVIQISPASFSTLPLILRRNFPNKSAPKEDIVHYMENILYILTYCNDLRYTVWSLIVENIIKLDVELQNEIDDVDDEDLNAALENGSGDETDSDSNNNNDDEGNETNFPELANEHLLPQSPNLSDKEDAGYDADYNEEEEVESELLHEEGDDEEYNLEIEGITDLSSKLDAVMQLIFKSTEKSFTEIGLEEGNGITLFNTLISIFRTFILPTHYTRCVQYLMFHMVQQQSDLTDSFLVMLLDVVFNSNEIASNRIKAMQYVCSFMARAKSLTRGQLLTVMKYLMSWCNEYVTEREKEVGTGKGGMERFAMLYCVLQGLMYIFCFRFRDLKKEDNDEEWELRLDKFFNKMIMSRFNPLKFCNETVVLIFARIVQKVDMCYCFSIIDKNKRERLNGIRDATANSESSLNRFERKQEFLDLEAYFPFDPLMLKDSKKIIHQNYIDWQDFDDSEDSE
ncbi:hypothetical protein BRETT_004493 [Brettanomyces bruxellensis]|uniref:RNA polymerase I-specific transcription initiation factor RRN3 n=1 Tax=Dekkera bruxellensis TaxID=5007 RepID=A0A871R866_DEKBR|nr:uncharacterized protein BRETT_004493 [Brettanomyces bruxellensis]QOU19272.1 hypothetical protein BRETT_004493 [Brettanomyces bruxellensis]